MAAVTRDPVERMSSEPQQRGREIPLAWTLVSVLALIGGLITVLVILPRYDEDFGLEGHLPLVFGATIAALVGRKFGYRWDHLQAGMVHGITLALPAILILYVVGTLIGVWIAAGIIPALISWGLAVMSPSIFLATTCLVCSVVSFVCGSSWTTAGTVGIAMVGIGQAMGIEPGYVAGAVISGAYFGDKLSPMSETTNLAPGVAGTDLFVHIRHMLYTTVPSWVIAMILYAIIGANLSGHSSLDEVDRIRELLDGQFNPSVLHLLPAGLVLVLVLRKQPALPSLAAGAGLAMVLALLRGDSLTGLLTVAFEGYKPSTGDSTVDELLARGGMKSMNGTVLLIICAMCCGGVLEKTGQLATLAKAILKLAHTGGRLIAATIATSIGLNLVAADQYIAIIVPGRMYKAAYDEQGLDARNLSRALEDGGTITSALVPWNSCGAYMATTLGVATLTYLPYAFFNLINPIMGIVLALLGITIVRRTPSTAGAEPSSPTDSGA